MQVKLISVDTNGCFFHRLTDALNERLTDALNEKVRAIPQKYATNQ